MALKVPFRKARGQAPSGAQDANDLVNQLARTGDAIRRRNELLANLPLDPQWQEAVFGPGFPITPDLLDVPGSQGYAVPRIWQYQPQWNIPGRHDSRHVPFETLKKAGEQPLFRACIEIRKNRLATLDWGFRVSPDYVSRIVRQSGRSQYEVENDLQSQYENEIDRLTSFWEVPDRRNGIEFADWLSQAREEQLVWDALAVYPQKTYGGDTLQLTVIDGSTIKPLLDEQGGRPMPPHPAFQQILYGFPRGDFTADTVDAGGQLVVPGAYSTSQLVYRRRVVRPWTPYGFSPVEQALLDGMLWDQRFRWIMQEYTEGAQPASWLINKGEVDWDARQLLAYEKFLNDRNAGKTGQRMRNQLLPAGIEPVRSEQNAERYKPDYDLFLIKLQAMHFGVTLPELGFTEPGGLGSQGYHEGEEDIQFRKDLSDIRWIERFITGISKAHLGMPGPVEFCFLGLDEEDEGDVETVDDSRVRGARMTLNEGRQKIGLPRLDFTEADMPMLMTQRGVVFLNGAASAAPPGVLIEPAELKTGGGDDGGATGAPKAKVQGSPAPARPVKTDSPTAAQASAAAKELAQFAKRLEKDPDAAGSFEFRHLDPELVKAAVAAGGAVPKGSFPAGFTPISSSPYTRPSS
jgi:hypothetical protein